MSEKFNIFGKNHDVVGSGETDLILKCKGKVKINYGNVYIDLFKDGAINVDSKCIFKRNDIGVKDGIYVSDDGRVDLKVGDTVINLMGEIGTTYVSFMAEQDTGGDEKYTAMKNIGFILSSLSDFDDSCLLNGIIYVEDELKLYTIVNGQVSEFKIEFPNPFTEQFVISKNDSAEGALLIVGNGKENSIAFDSFYIYTGDGETYLDSSGKIHFLVGDKEILSIDKQYCVFTNKVCSNYFMSSTGATSDYGFRLYMEGGESTLEVDNLVVRNQDSTQNQIFYPTYWFYSNNIILECDDNSSEDEDEDSNPVSFILTLALKNTFQKGYILYVYLKVSSSDLDQAEENKEFDTFTEEYNYLMNLADVAVNAADNVFNTLGPDERPNYLEEKDEIDSLCEYYHSINPNSILDEDEQNDIINGLWDLINQARVFVDDINGSGNPDNYYEYILVPLEVTDVSESDNSVTVTVLEDRMDDDTKEIYNYLDTDEVFVNQWIFCVYTGDKTGLLRLLDNTFDVVTTEDGTNFNVNTRIGDISTVTGYDYGIYSQNAVFENAEYASDGLSTDDNSNKFASTKWTLSLIEDLKSWVTDNFMPLV